MKKHFNFKSMYRTALVALCLMIVGVGEMRADEITVYVTGEIFTGTGDDAWDNSTSTIKVDIRKGYPECFECDNNSFNGVKNVDMTNTGYTYNGYPIYSYTLNQAGAQWRFKHYKNGAWKEDYTTEWHSTTGQIYRGYGSGVHHWVTYGRDVTFYATPEKMDGSKWEEGTHSLFANFKYGDGESEWKRQQMTKTAYTYNGDAIYTCTMLLPYNVIKNVQFLYNDGSDHDLYVYTPSPQLTANDVEGKVFRGYISSAHTWAAYGRDVTIYTIPDYLFKGKETPFNESTHYPAVCIQMGTGSTWNTENLTKTAYTYDSYPIYSGTILIDQNKFWEYQIKYFNKSGDTQVDLYQFNQSEPKAEYAPSYIDDKLYHGWNGESHDFFSYRYDVALDMQSGGGGSTSIIAIDGSAMPSATMPGRDGYAFGGYWTETNGGGTQYYNADGSSTRNWDSRTITTLYAKWTEDKHTVTVKVGSAGGGVFSYGGSSSLTTKDISGIGISTATGDIVVDSLNPAWRFKKWEYDGAKITITTGGYTSKTIRVNATADATITAVFEPRFGLIGSLNEDGDPAGGMPNKDGVTWGNVRSKDYEEDFEVISFTAVGTEDGTGVDLRCTRTLEPNKQYKFQIVDRATIGRDRFCLEANGSTVLEANQSITLNYKEQMNANVLINTVGYGEYTFRITNIAATTYNPTVTVDRPTDSKQLTLKCGYSIDAASPVTLSNDGGTAIGHTNEGGDGFDISDGGFFKSGSHITFTATPATGYVFDGWYTDNTYETRFATDNPMTMTKGTNANVTVYARFIEKTNTFTDGASTGYWNNISNWSLGSLPTINERVVITKPVTVDIAHALAKRIILDQSDSNTGKLTIQANKGLEVAGTITRTTDGSNRLATCPEDLILESSSDGNASLIFNKQ